MATSFLSLPPHLSSSPPSSSPLSPSFLSFSAIPSAQLISASAAYCPAATVHFWLCRLLARSQPEYTSLLKSEWNIEEGGNFLICCWENACVTLPALGGSGLGFRRYPRLAPPLKVAVTTAQWMQWSQLGRGRIPAQTGWAKAEWVTLSPSLKDYSQGTGTHELSLQLLCGNQRPKRVHLNECEAERWRKWVQGPLRNDPWCNTRPCNTRAVQKWMDFMCKKLFKVRPACAFVSLMALGASISVSIFKSKQ